MGVVKKSEMMKLLGLDLKSPPGADQWPAFLARVEQLFLELESDNDQQKELSIELAQASKLLSLGTMATGIAHELNNPLAGIQGHSEFLLDSKDLSSSDRKRVERIVTLTERMTIIVRHVLTLARKPGSQASEKFLIREALDTALQLSLDRFNYENIDVKNEVPNDLEGFGNIHGIITVIQNLVNNSFDEFVKLESKGKKPELLFSLDEVKTNDTQFVISVTDNAGGISPENLPRVFDPFFTTKQVGSGTGLGLSLAQNLMREFSGDLTVESSGESTTFSLIVPKANDASEGITKTSSEVFGSSKSSENLEGRKKSILVVDDEQDIIELLVNRLDAEFDVMGVTSPVDAIQCLNEKNYDILLTDIKMPVLSGHDLIDIAKKLNPSMKLMVMSGHFEASKKYRENQAKDIVVFHKPLPRKLELIEEIHRAS